MNLSIKKIANPSYLKQIQQTEIHAIQFYLRQTLHPKYHQFNNLTWTWTLHLRPNVESSNRIAESDSKTILIVLQLSKS